jgi:uncharacterized membrane protein
MVLGAATLAALLIHLDASLSLHIAARFPRIFGASSEGARTILATIAGSMITVSGVTFSITIVALSLAANQYSPRILRNFMADRGNQVVLGVFVSAFVYCVIVLRTIRGGEDSFIPSYALVGAIALALVAIGFLIFFVHHIATMIQASTILANIHKETLAVLNGLEIDPVEKEENTASCEPTATGFGISIPSACTGYIQGVDSSALIAWAVQRDVVLRMLRGIGEFVIEGEPILKIYGNLEGDADLKSEFEAYYSIGNCRTIDQDPAFGIRQIVDIALKALSPGINDTATAETCLDYLGAILYRAARLRLPDMRQYCNGHLRVLIRQADFIFLVDQAFHEIRQNAAENLAVYLRLAKTLARLAGAPEEHRNVIAKHLWLVAESARAQITIPHDRKILASELSRAASALQIDLKT